MDEPVFPPNPEAEERAKQIAELDQMAMNAPVVARYLYAEFMALCDVGFNRNEALQIVIAKEFGLKGG